MTLYINCCMRDGSRTERLANALLTELGEYTEIKLTETDIAPLDRESLALKLELVGRGDYSHPMFDLAKQFASADKIVIAAPYWDLSFPALLKAYLENIYVIGIVSEYDENDEPVGLCRGSDLYYVTTAGGKYDRRFGYGAIEEMATTCFSIGKTHLIYADELDIRGHDTNAIIAECEAEIHEKYGKATK